MKFYRELYVGEKVKRKAAKIKFRLRFHKIVTNAYVITLCDGSDELEYFHASLLAQPYYKKRSVFVVGLAGDQEEAVEMIQSILSHSMKTQYQYKMKEYIKAKQEKII